MRDAELLYLLAIGLFIYESLISVPLDAVVLLRRAWGWRRAEPLVLRSGAGPALVLAHPLPPLGVLAVGKKGGRLALAEVRPRVDALLAKTRPLRFAVNLLFLSVFVGGALLVWIDEVKDVPVLVTIGAMWLATIIEALLARRRLESAHRPGWQELIVALLSPLSALRLHDIMAKKALADLDGLALVGALSPLPERTEVFRVALARARFLGERDEAAIAALAREAGLDPDALFRPPEREGPEAKAYCPVCQAQFMRTDTTCEGCRDASLILFEPRVGGPGD